MRSIEKIVFKGHGHKSSPKSQKEVDIVLEDEEVIEKYLKNLMLYLQTDLEIALPQIDFKSGPLKDKLCKFVGVDHQAKALVIIVE